jgi:hypothetical protein
VVIASVASALTSGGNPTPQAGQGTNRLGAAGISSSAAAPQPSAAYTFTACTDHTVQVAGAASSATVGAAINQAWLKCGILRNNQIYPWQCTLYSSVWSCIGGGTNLTVQIIDVTVNPNGSGVWSYSGV